MCPCVVVVMCACGMCACGPRHALCPLARGCSDWCGSLVLCCVSAVVCTSLICVAFRQCIHFVHAWYVVFAARVPQLTPDPSPPPPPSPAYTTLTISPTPPPPPHCFVWALMTHSGGRQAFYWPFSSRRRALSVRFLSSPADGDDDNWIWSGELKLDTLGEVPVKIRTASPVGGGGGGGSGGGGGGGGGREYIARVKLALVGASVTAVFERQVGVEWGWVGLGWIGLGSVGLGWARLGCIGLGWVGFGSVHLGRVLFS